MNRKAFTLIELLVVIAIIAILAAILFPVFARARLKAEQVTCLSNLKQIAMALRMYASDYDGMLPALSLPAPGNIWFDRTTIIAPYVQGQAKTSAGSSGQVWRCPSAPPPEPGYARTYGGQSGNYVKNGWGGGETYWGWSYSIITQITDPVNVIMFGDGWGGGNTGVIMQVDTYNASPTPDTGLTADPPYWPATNKSRFPWCNAFGGWHFGKCNFNFIDGHAKPMDLETVAHTFYYRKGSATPIRFYLDPLR
ncbi:MAG: prepilin-type N-terminal cleavage/methylation domain-containing protein [candidate division WS1 bacterium]|nr:prepilin-type N-terminal cleavage/methylation domain-containing protein [candidate division WS1 bacterium]